MMAQQRGRLPAVAVGGIGAAREEAYVQAGGESGVSSAGGVRGERELWPGARPVGKEWWLRQSNVSSQRHVRRHFTRRALL